MESKQFNLRDYLRPGGIRPYDRLLPDLQEAFDAGYHVYLYGVAGHFILAGHPDMTSRPWSNGDKWFKTAKQAMR